MIDGLITWGPEFEIRYAILDPSIITNKLSPECVSATNETAEEYIAKLNENNGFYIKLEESILNEGFRNPILVVAGWYPSKIDPRFPARMAKKGLDKIVEDHSNKIYCLTNGGSRLWIATNHKIPVPCIVADYVGRFKDKPIISSVDEALDYYQDRPEAIVFGAKGISVKKLLHYHLED